MLYDDCLLSESEDELVLIVGVLENVVGRLEDCIVGGVILSLELEGNGRVVRERGELVFIAKETQ